MKTHFVFDLDDTLTNSYEVNQQLFVDTFTAHFPSIDQETIREHHYASRGRSMIVQFEEMIERLSLEGVTGDQLVKENEQLHIKSVEKFNNMSMFDSTIEVLKELKSKGKKLHVLTNRQYGSQNAIFQTQGIKELFDDVISCIDEGHEKPDPYCFNKLVEKYGDDKSNYVYFGDSKTDRDFALNAGVDFVIIDQYLNDKKFYKMVLELFMN